MVDNQTSKVTVFYSWQSDSSSRTNRNFIEDALERAVRDIKKEGLFSVVPVIDRDTKDIPGAPNIGETILQKIDNSQVFLCDVTIINPLRQATDRPTPNPNVLVELGYALKALGPHRIIMVLNKAYGKVEELPFDLRFKRVMTYELAAEVDSRAEERAKLVSQIEGALESIILTIQQEQKEDTTPAVSLKNYLFDERHAIALHELMTSAAKTAAENISEEKLSIAITPEKENIIKRFSEYEEAVVDLEELLILGCYFGHPRHNELWSSCISRLAHRIEMKGGTTVWLEFRWYPILVLTYAAGIASVASANYGALYAILSKNTKDRYSELSPLVNPLVGAMLELNRMNVFQLIPGQEKKFTPLSEHLFELFRPKFESILAIDNEFETLFDRFELMYSLTYADYSDKKDGRFWLPLGRFAWKFNRLDGRGIDPIKDLKAQRDNLGANWLPTKAGFFQGSVERTDQLMNKLEAFVSRLE